MGPSEPNNKEMYSILATSEPDVTFAEYVLHIRLYTLLDAFVVCRTFRGQRINTVTQAVSRSERYASGIQYYT